MDRSVVELTQNLVRINSITPQAVSETARLGGEANLAAWLQKYLEARSFRCQLDWVEPGRPNLIAYPGYWDPSRPSIAFTAHMDTVDVGDMPEPFSATIHNGVLYGRGACDVKGTMAAMITAIIDWSSQQKQPAFNPLFIATMGEEAGTLGSKRLAKQGMQLDAILVGEPTGLQPVVAHRGLWRLALQTLGVSCHSSRPENGVNAVDAMVDLINAIRQHLIPKWCGTGNTTFSFTTIHGGSMINMIPDSCRVEVDSRCDPGIDIKGFRNALIKVIDDQAGKVEWSEIQCDPGYRVQENSLLLSTLARAMADEGLQFVQKEEPWYSDAGHFSAAGYDTLLWGAGDIRWAHTRDEIIKVKDLEKAVAILKRLLAHYQVHYESVG
ncbi:MAG TPA: M20 family metallopeptidase [bacterium]|jgi:acetylornithine deacetylase|nr:M20 family metallopeptidase [bacterium]HNT64909.1 M20 family metallopeptidase [bacterium]